MFTQSSIPSNFIKLVLQSAVILLLSPIQHISAQGELDPPTSPTPSMHSIEEIWQKISERNQRIQNQQTQLNALQSETEKAIEALEENQRNTQALFEQTDHENPWIITPVDFGADYRYLSLTFSPEGFPAIAYEHIGANYTNVYAKCAIYNGKTWRIYSFPQGNRFFIGRQSLAYSPEGQLHLVYSNGSTLHYAKFDGENWTTTSTAFDYTVSSPALLFSPSGTPTIVSAGFNRVYMIQKQGDSWVTRTIVSESQGYHLSNFTFYAAMDPNGNPAVAFHDYDKAELFFAEKIGETWTVIKPPKSGLDAVGYYCSLAYSPQGYAAIAHKFYFDFPLYTYQESWGWHTRSLKDYGVRGGESTSIAFSPSGLPFISCYDNVEDALKLLYSDGSDWQSETIDSMGNVGFHSSLAFSPQGYIGIAYKDIDNNGVKFAIRKPFYHQ